MNDVSIEGQKNNTIIQVVLFGLLTFFLISSVSILHANQYEFIQLRFPGLSWRELSYFDSLLYISYLVVGILVGFLADQWGKRKIFVVLGSSGSIVFFFLMTIAPNYNSLLLFRFCQGSFTVMAWQVLMTLVLDFSSDKDRGKFSGIFGIFLALAMGLGPMVGGMMAKVGDFIPYYIAIGANLIVLLVSLILLKEPTHLKRRPTIKENLTIYREVPQIIIPGIFNFIDRFHMGFITFILPYFIQQVLGGDSELRGMVMGIYAMPFIILQYPIGKASDKHGRFKFLIAGSISFGLILSVIGIIGSFSLGTLIISFIILGVFAGITGPPSMALVGDLVDEKDTAIGMGFFNFVGNIGIIMGPVVGGMLIDYTNFIIAFFMAGLMELISLVICLFFFRKYRKSKNIQF